MDQDKKEEFNPNNAGVFIAPKIEKPDYLKNPAKPMPVGEALAPITDAQKTPVKDAPIGNEFPTIVNESTTDNMPKPTHPWWQVWKK